MEIVLASMSERRKDILSMLNVEFKAVDANVDENIHIKDIGEMVKELSKKKAKAVLDTFDRDTCVIAGDTVVALDGEIFLKPKDEQEAKEMLIKLSGKTHLVYSGYCVMTKTETISGFTKSEISFMEIDQEVIEEYLKLGEYKGKAGAYAIQGVAGKFISNINGCYYSVMGLSLNNVYLALKSLKLI